MAHSSILIVEDEEKLASILKDYLTHASFNTHMLHDGADVIPWLKSNPCDLILLDIMLPNKDGIQICREIRAFSDVPILMRTARIDEVDICKPFSPREVVA